MVGPALHDWPTARRGGLAAFAVLLLAGCRAAPTFPTVTVSAPPPAATSTAFPPAPQATISPTPACPESGTWIDFHYRGVAVAQEVPARVYLPPCYDAGGRRYPTAYFLHGKPYTEQQWISLGLPDLLEAGAGAGSLPPMIIVLARQPEPLFSQSDGGPGSYETEFVEGLVAAVDGAFRTVTRPEGRAVVGLSRGGVWALEIALRHPEIIGAVAALSPALAVNYARDAYDPMLLAASADPLPAQVMLAAGDDDWARAGTESLAAALAARGFVPEVVIVSGSHADPTWQQMLPDVLDFLASALGAESVPPESVGISGLQ